MLVVGLSLGFFWTSAQSITSPYTNFGIGELNNFSLPHQFGMANVGNSGPHAYYINLQNPALLTYNVLTSFQIGLKGDMRSYNTENFSTSDNTGSISQMVLAVPLKISKWTSAVSLLPYSSVNYNLYSNQLVLNSTDSVSNLFEGSGGLSQLSWSHGVRVQENLNLGVRASYVFGSISRSVTNTIFTLATNDGFIVNYEDFINYSDIVFAAAAAYRIKLADKKFVHLGVVYDFPGKLNGSKTETLSRQTAQGGLISEVNIAEDDPTSFQLPTKLSLGISIENISKFQLGVDASLLQWASTNGENGSTLKNSLSIALGGQFTPDFKDVNNYLKRLDYRFGAGYKQLPYMVNGREINEFGINFGVSFPTKNFSSIDTGFRFGTRGEIAENLIRENFAQIILGLTINDRWFIKRRYD